MLTCHVHHRQVRRTAVVRAASAAVEGVVLESVDGDYCMPSQVEVDNHSHVGYTVLTIEVKDYPGAASMPSPLDAETEPSR